MIDDNKPNHTVNMLMSFMAFEESAVSNIDFGTPLTIKLTGTVTGAELDYVRITEEDIIAWAKAIEEKRPVLLESDPGLWVSRQREVVDLMKNPIDINPKIAAIKKAREIGGLGLKEAKDAVEDAVKRGLF